MAKRGRKPQTFKGYSKKEVRHLIKLVNDSLYRLEKRGVSDVSTIYRTIEHYAISNPNGTGKMYNVNTEKGTIRVSKDLSRYKTKEEQNSFIDVLQSILNAKTRTVKGTRESIKKAWETVKERYNLPPHLTQKAYGNIWKTYREQVSKDAREKIGSSQVMDLIEQKISNYLLSQDELNEAMKYLNNGFDEGVADIVKRFEDDILPFE